jgi:hypothetical protein
MGTLPFRSKGDPITADEWNALVRLAQEDSVLLGRPLRVVWAKTTVAVATTDADFTVTDIVPFDGSTWTEDDPLTVKNDIDKYRIGNGVTGKIVYCKDPTGDESSWRPLDFAPICPDGSGP